MSRKFSFLIPLGLLLTLVSAETLRAESASPTEVRLREALRNTMIQLRTAQTEQAALQAAQSQSVEEKKLLSAQVEALTKQAKTDKEDNDKIISDLKAKAAEQASELTQLKGDLAKTQANFKQAAELATAKESERAKLAEHIIILDRTIADQRTKNAALFKLGNEILARYEKFGLGTALTAKEPFVGITRVKLENYVQDYQDKLAEQKVGPTPAAQPAQ